MNIIVTITKDILLKAKGCGSEECAIALALNELVPCAIMWKRIVYLTKEHKILTSRETSLEQRTFITRFDEYSTMCSMDVMASDPEFVNRQITVDIPDSVIEYWYGDAVKAAQHIANSSTLKLSYEKATV